MGFMLQWTPANAHPAEKYAPNSMLAEGRWATVEVTTNGIQFIPNSVLTKLGFNPATVNVYGYGGRPVPGTMRLDEPDDLPLLPVKRVADGILFFGTDNFLWEPTQRNGGMFWTHTVNPYSDVSRYFLSDRPLPEWKKTPQTVDYPVMEGAKSSSTFTARLVHEVETVTAGETGGIYLGEDFRTNHSHNYVFSLPGNTGKRTMMKASVGTDITNGTGSLIFTANGQRLPSTTSDNISAMTGDAQFITMTNTIKEIPNPGTSLNLGVSFSSSGSFTKARLDYIEVEYERSLNMSDQELHFYDYSTVPTTYSISGCTQETVIWDFSDRNNPTEVGYTLANGTASFTSSASGLREFVAFQSSARPHSPQNVAAVSNQDLHSLETPDMVIITLPEYQSQAEEVAQLRRNNDGMMVHVLTPEKIYNEFSSGVPDVGAFRKILKMFRDRWESDPENNRETRYCLLVGKATYDNKHKMPEIINLGYNHLLTWQSLTGTSGSTSYSTDDYIGMTDDYEENFRIGAAKIRVAVGRWPVTSQTEAETMVEKLTEYVEKPNYGGWRNNVMVIADDQDSGVHLRQAEKVISAMSSNGNGKNFIYEKLYLDSYELVQTGIGATYPDAKQRLLNKWQEGQLWINYIGHASPRGWGHEHLLTWTDLTGMNNTNLPFLFAATCEFARHDLSYASGAEEMVLNPNGGIIGTICPNRTVFITQNGTLNEATSKYVFSRDSNNRSLRVGDIMINGKNDYPGADDNKLRFSLLGDPAMRLPSPEMNIEITNIGDMAVADIADVSDYPVIAAKSRIKINGKVTDADGNPDPTFNGVLNILLFDAEKAVETKGNGKEGKVENYNDRSCRLFTGSTRIINGEWEASILMPSEIENNYSPAMINLYAYDESGKEANGSCDRIYVYGYDDTVEEDTEGPVITRFVLNSDYFTPGGLTHGSPVVLADFSDISGINISDAGIGHKMSLRLDKSTNYMDVDSYYTPDPMTEGGGSIAYPLDGLAPGEHSLELTVWDNANNSTTASLDFIVQLNRKPGIFDLRTDVNPAREDVKFILTSDMTNNSINYQIEVFDLNGRTVWKSEKNLKTKFDGIATLKWDLTDNGGKRVPRGIYLYRATVESSEGVTATKSSRLAVAGQ